MRRERPAALAALAGALLLMGAAPDPADRLPDPAAEARARALFQQLRCVVCQNQSIDDSEADLASDLRRIVRQQVAAGRTDAQIRAFLVQRYGEFILLQPPLSPGNAVLWLAPLAAVLLGGAYIWRKTRSAPIEEAALTAQEEDALTALAAGDSGAKAGAGKIAPGR